MHPALSQKNAPINSRAWRTIHNEIWKRRLYQFQPASLQDLTIIDAGANIGMATNFFNETYPNATVHSIEPVPKNFDTLKRVASKKTILHNAAVGFSGGTIELHIDPKDPLAASETDRRSSKKATHSITVPLMALSSIIDRKIDFLKLDVEGSELDVLLDLVGEDKLKHVQRIYIEYHRGPSWSDSKLGDIYKILGYAGFWIHTDGSGKLYQPNRGESISIFGAR